MVFYQEKAFIILNTVKKSHHQNKRK
jgi:hypothetical protein